MISDIEDYFRDGCGRCDRFATADCSTRLWAEGLGALRQICRDAGLTETVKWGHPCYLHDDRNIALIGAFRDDYRITFFNAALMTDPQGLLEKAGPNTAHAGVIRFTSNGAAAALAHAVRAYLDEAIGYAEAGVVAPRVTRAIDWPDELTAALDDDPALAQAFHRLTAGRQRSYVILLSSAKTAATRTARLAKARAKIMAGKGAQER